MKKKLPVVLCTLILSIVMGCGIKEPNTVIIPSSLRFANSVGYTSTATVTPTPTAIPEPTSTPFKSIDLLPDEEIEEVITTEEYGSLDSYDDAGNFEPIQNNNHNNTVMNDVLTIIGETAKSMLSPQPSTKNTPTSTPVAIDDNSPEAYGINTKNALWVTTDDGKKYRYNTIAKAFNLSTENAKTLIEAYYCLSNEEFYGWWYNADDEITIISYWISLAAEIYQISYDEALMKVIDGYSNGYLSVEEVFGNLDDEYEYPDTEEELFAYYAVREEDDPYGLVDFTEDYPDDPYADEEIVFRDVPISMEGIELTIGDKVMYTSDDLLYYGGTIYDIENSKVKIRWEMKGDAFAGLYQPLSAEDKSFDTLVFNPLNIPSDNEWYYGFELEKIDNQAW